MENYTKEQLQQIQESYRLIGTSARKKINENMSEEEQERIAYNLRLAAAKAKYPKPKPKPKVFKPKPYQLLDYTEAKKIFWFKYLNPEGDFKIDNENKTIVQELVKWSIRDKSCKFDLEKGIFLAGDVGCGKTRLMKALSEFTKGENLCTAFDYITEEEMRRQIKETAGAAFYGKLICGQMCYDDIGTNPKLKIYGEDIHLVNDIIKVRYNKWNGNRLPSHFTSNITKEELRSDNTKYDLRSTDRLKQMCNVYFMKGNSRR